MGGALVLGQGLKTISDDDVVFMRGPMFWVGGALAHALHMRKLGAGLV